MTAPGTSRAAILAIAEQGLVSGAGFATAIAAGRLLPAADLAGFGLMLGLLLALGGIHRNVVVIPFILAAARGLPGQAPARFWPRLNLAVSALLAAATSGIGATLLAGGWVPHWAGAATLACGAVLLPASLFDFHRRRLFPLATPRGLLPAAAFLAVQGAGVLLAFLLPAPGLMLLAGTLAAAHAAAGLTARTVAGAGAGAAGHCDWRPALRRLGRDTWPTVSGHLAYAAYTQLNILVVALFFPPAGIAAYAASRALLNPVAALVTALDNLQKPDLAHGHALGGDAALPGLVLRHILRQAALASPYLALMAGPGAAVSALAYGGRFTGMGPLLAAWALCMLALAVSVPLENALLTLGRGRVLLASRCLAAIGGVGGICVLAGPLGLPGAVLGTALGLGLGAVLPLRELARLRPVPHPACAEAGAAP